jgi:PBP1b-binding outer membrane lipoprotein LpoB
MKNNIILCVLILVVASCGPQERVSKEVFDAVNEKMEVKKLSDFEIIEEAMVWGDSISTEAQNQLI